jgi:RNA polymerase sigma-70 factor (ECF subfamily)
LTCEKLISQCRKGDKKAQKALYMAFSQKMYLHCYRYVKNRDDAEEILTDGFVKVFENLHSFEYRDERSFDAWIKKIMINEALLFLRKKKQLTFIEGHKVEEVQADVSLDMNLRAEDIYKLILALPTGYRTVFNMFAIEGYSHKEIASLLNITESTSRSQLTKARAMLQVFITQNNMRHEN